jgi:hypothetical protein
MAKAAIILLADTESHADLGRAANALAAAGEFQEAGDELTVIFDGAGTRWVPELAGGEHRLSPRFEEIKEAIGGACSYCAGAFGVREQIEQSEVSLLDEHEGHPSIRTLVADGYEVLTF